MVNALCIISLYTTNNCATIFLGDQPRALTMAMEIVSDM